MKTKGTVARRTRIRKFCILAILTLVVLQTDIVLLGSFQVPPSEKPVPFNHGIMVGAYYYTWYGGTRHWWEGYTNTPILGRYSSWDPGAADWHIKWAVDNGINFFAVSWTGPHSWEEDALKHGLLQSQYIDYIRFCIFYESVIRMQAIQAQNAQYNTTFISDIKYIASEFFNNPQYLKLDGKPVLIIYYVIYLYQSLRTDGDPANTIRQLRQELSSMGFDIYLVADITGFPPPGSPFENFLKCFNATTQYMPNLSGDWNSVLDYANSTGGLALNYTRSENMSYIPDVYPGFDRSHSEMNSGPPILARNVSRFAEFCEIARYYAEQSAGVVMVSTWNEWHEGTSIEPAQEYGSQYLEIIRTVLCS